MYDKEEFLSVMGLFYIVSPSFVSNGHARRLREPYDVQMTSANPAARASLADSRTVHPRTSRSPVAHVQADSYVLV